MKKSDAPAPAGLAAMTAALGQEAQIEGIERLVGGDMAVYRMELVQGANRRPVVLKQFPPGVGVPANEWDALCFARAAELPSPAPLLYDSGDWFGGPAIVMEALAGRPCFHPTDLEAWIAALADTLALLHATPIDAASASLRRPGGIWARWGVSGLAPGPRTEAIAAAIAEISTREWVKAFCHCDFHPGNVLFRDGAVVGVVDWISARAAPFLNDVGRLRGALAVWPGGAAPDLLAAAYAERTGRSLEGVAHWDILTGALTLQSTANGVPRLFEDFQVPLDAAEIAARSTVFIDAALECLGMG